MEDLTEDDIGCTAPKKSGMTRTERQYLQIQRAVEGDKSMDSRVEELKREMDLSKYPLHMIEEL